MNPRCIFINQRTLLIRRLKTFKDETKGLNGSVHFHLLSRYHLLDIMRFGMRDSQISLKNLVAVTILLTISYTSKNKAGK